MPLKFRNIIIYVISKSQFQQWQKCWGHCINSEGSSNDQ
jgi:hypothetical protein